MIPVLSQATKQSTRPGKMDVWFICHKRQILAMKALVLQLDNGESHVAFVADDEIDLDDWVEDRYVGLQLLGVIRVELRDKLSKIVRRISC